MLTPKSVALVVGGSRGIGRQIAIDLAQNGHAVVVTGKSTSDAAKVIPYPPDPHSSESTINTVAREITEAGGDAIAIAADTRDEVAVQSLLSETMRSYGRLDVVIYNTGAIWWASVEDTPMKRFQLLQRVNPEGLYSVIQASLPLFKQNGWKGRIVVVSPPIYSRFFRGKTAYAMGKIAMSVLTKGLAMDFERQGKTEMAITSLWPATTIFSDAVLAILRSPAGAVNGLLELDEDFLRNYSGVSDFSKYSLVDGATPRRIMPATLPDLRVAEQDDEGKRVDSAALRISKL
ncbi:MAG: hypothetical protein M1837_002805 [Sclerophora amabilis]|nr:MAG: hypothetical protein M1837_002805 [Sclerophora amabilis]